MPSTAGSVPDELARLPFSGGWFVFFGYELARGIEPVLATLPAAPMGFPQALAVRCPGALVFDHETQQTFAVAENRSAFQRMIKDYDQLTANRPDAGVVGRVVEEAPEKFLSAVDRVKDYILAGDIFQANISRIWQAHYSGSAAGLFSRLRESNPAPFAGLACWQGNSVISSSPERLVAMRGDHIQTRPIAGTFPRSNDPDADQSQRDGLLADPKERAEHVMLIDLERNDLGRVCTPGSIGVSEFMGIESYPNIHHIVSAIDGRRRPDVSAVEVIKAVFPGGTITGCPKLRCMQIIGELEGVGRGPYTGAMGYMNLNGDMDLNILIRSLHLAGQQLSLRAGAGIVADSQPQRELAETRHKARGMLAALNHSHNNSHNNSHDDFQGADPSEY